MGGTATDAEVTFVESDLTADTTWTQGDGPYRIIQDIEIEPGAALTIEPGTRIEIAEDVTVSISGSLQTNGTAARPVEITRSGGVAAEYRWQTLRYNGTTGSVLELQHTTLEGGNTGITVASGSGRVRVVDSTVQEFTTAGLAVAGTGTAPPIAVQRSTFRAINGHAIRVDPGAGTVDRVSLRATPNSVAGEPKDSPPTHTLRLETSVGVSLDSIRLSYDSDGSVASVGAGSINRIGVDRNRNGSIDQSFSGAVAAVSSTDSQLEISLSESVQLPRDGQLIVEYDDTVNPTTRGVYPVEVQLRDGGRQRLATGVQAALVVGNVVSPYDSPVEPDPPTDAGVDPDRPTTQVRDLTVRGGTFTGISGAGVFVATDRLLQLRVARAQMDGVSADAISVRAAQSESYFRENELSSGENGIRVVGSGKTSVTATENRIQNARTGIRLRQTGRVTLRRNTLTNNRVHGVEIDTDSREIRIDARNNSITSNGRDGLAVSGWRVSGGQVRGNEISRNAQTGIAIQTADWTRGLAVRDNTLADNGGHGVELQSNLVVYGASVTDNQFTNNAGAGLIVSSPITHRANLSVVNNVVAANAYGIVLRGVFGTTVRDNDIVFNTNRFAEPVLLPNVRAGTGIYVAEGAAGAIIDEGDSEVPLDYIDVANLPTAPRGGIVPDPDGSPQFSGVPIDDQLVAVLRTNDTAFRQSVGAAALRLRSASRDIPTGIRIPKTDSTSVSYRFADNGIYGQERGMTVDIESLVTANTNTLVLTKPTRTVAAESNYWGSSDGPYHSSILPEGEGNAVVTSHGWIDFIPFRVEPTVPEYARPTAAIAHPTNPVPGTEVRVAGIRSTSAEGGVARYRFQIDGDRRPVTDRAVARFDMPNRSVDVTLTVEDGLGIDSAPVTARIQPGTPTPTVQTPTPTVQTPTPTPRPPTATPETPEPSTTSPPAAQPEPTLLESFSSLPGFIGGLCYLLALVLGVHSVWVTVTNRSLLIKGLRVQQLAGAGVLIWIVGGVLGEGPLLTIGVTGAALWAGLTGAAYVVVRVSRDDAARPPSPPN